MATTSATETATGSDLQELAKRHLWMHFTRHGRLRRGGGPDHRPRRGRLRLGRARQPLPRRALGAVLRQRRPRAHGAGRGGRAPGRGARLLHHLELRAPAGDRAGDADRLAGARRPEPGLLHLRRLGGGGVGDQAGPRLPPADREPAQDEVHHPRDRLPRHDPRGAGRDRHLGPPLRVRAAGAGRLSRCRTRTATTGRRTATRSGRPTRSRRRSSTSTPTRSPR